MRMPMSRTLGIWALAGLLATVVSVPVFAQSTQTKAWKPWNGEIPKAPEHVKVKKGETLSGYAGKYLWPLIWLENQQEVDNPHLIFPGQRIKIPPNDGFVGGGRGVHDDASYAPPIAEVMFATKGEVTFFRVNGDEIKLYAGDPIYGSGTIQTDSGVALLRTADGARLKVHDRSQVLINLAVKDDEKKSFYRLIDQKQGKVLYRLPKYPDPSYRFEVKTPVATVDPQSRFFQIDIESGADTRVSAFDGKLRVIGRSRFVDVPVDHGVAISSDGKRMTETRLPDAPMLQSPAGVTSTTVNFTWREVANADRYAIQIASDIELTDMIFSGTIYDDTTFEMEMRNPGDYYWLVESVNELGFGSVPRNPLRFTVSDRYVTR